MALFWRRPFRRWSEQRALARRAIPDALWQQTLDAFAFLARLPEPDQASLRKLTSLFLDTKQFSGAQGLSITDDMAVAIAAQACLPVLHLGLACYDSFIDIVVHSGEVVARRQEIDEHGIVHEFDEVFTGEAMHDGLQVTLSWEDVAMAGMSHDWAYSVVIHEMAHILDMRNGALDGMPPLPGLAAQQRWQAVLQTDHAVLRHQLQARTPTVLDPYAAESVDEFFAVACEAFFIAPHPLRQTHPDLYCELKAFFQQDPARHAPEQPALRQ